MWYQAYLLRGYRQKAAKCLAIYVSVLHVTVPACIAVMSVTYTVPAFGRRPLLYLSVWLAAPRGAADIYVSLCFGPIWLLPVTRLLVKAIYVIHLSMVRLPPLCCLVRPTKYNIPSCMIKSILAPQQLLVLVICNNPTALFPSSVRAFILPSIILYVNVNVVL